MKKFTAFVLCLVLLCAMALPVSAAAYMSISASSSTLYRGDSFTLTVSLSNDQPVSNGGVVLSYDTGAFEMVSGSRHVGDFGGVTVGNQGGVFVFETDTVASGTIFTFDMKVKSGAAFGSYSISGSPSLNIECGLGGTTVTVACDHSFGGASRVDDTNHQSACSVCGEKRTEAHSWNSGTVTKEATCKDTGSKNVTCTVCGAAKTETIPTNSNHPYSNWTQNDESTHYRTCNLCGGKDTEYHDWNGGEIVEAPTCQQTGSVIYTCYDCGATLMEGLDLAEHTYRVAAQDETSHHLVCSVCGHETVEEHLCDDVVENDETGHFQTCTACGMKMNQTPHTPGPDATETTDQVCLDCGWILQPMGEHIHYFSTAWLSDLTGHWHKCSGCSEKQAFAVHSYDNDCDADCNICHLERTTEHQPGERLLADETGHWLECQVCGEKLEAAAHIPGPEATITAAQVCTACGYELAPMVPHEHVFDANGTLHYHECICGERYEADLDNCTICSEANRQFPWYLVCIGLAAVILVLLIAVIVLAVKLGRRKKADFEFPKEKKKKSKKQKELPPEEQPKEEWVFE